MLNADLTFTFVLDLMDLNWSNRWSSILLSVLTCKAVFRLNFFYLLGYNTLPKHLAHGSRAKQVAAKYFLYSLGWRK